MLQSILRDHILRAADIEVDRSDGLVPDLDQQDTYPGQRWVISSLI